MLQLLTTTGGRPEPWRLAERWAAAQRYDGRVRWIIVDDVEPAQDIRFQRDGWSVIIVRPTPRWRPGDNTQARNLLAGLELVDRRHPLVIWEDDDYYSPDWLRVATDALGRADLVGETSIHYYNVALRRWRRQNNLHHAALSATALRGPAINALADTASRVGTFIDHQLWKTYSATKHLYDSSHVISIKGMPGRPGIGRGHMPNFVGAEDPTGATLRGLIGDDAAAYDRWGIPPRADGHAGHAIVVGSGRCVWDDLRALPDDWPVFAVNDMIVYAPRVDHAVSHHPDKLAHWNALRTRAGLRTPRESSITTHSSLAASGIDRAWPQFRGDGSSALLAVRVALALGHAPVYVAGVPLDAGGYVWSDPRDEVYDFARYRRAWQQAESELRGRVSAVSGWMREWLGRPSGAMVPA